MDDFRIIQENTLNYKGNRLFVMMLRDGDKFGVEVVDKTKTFGRKYTENRKEAEKLFDVLSSRLKRCDDLAIAEKAIKMSFERMVFKEIVFLLTVGDKMFTQKECGRMVAEFKLSVLPFYNVLLDEEKQGALTVEFWFEKGGASIGRYAGTRFSNDFKFELF